MRPLRTSATALVIVCLHLGLASAQPVTMRYTEGSGHAFLSLRATDGATGTLLATCEQLEIVHRSRVTNHLVYRFKDGSIDDETTVYSIAGTLRMISYHLVQKGPAFPTQSELTIDARTGAVTAVVTDEKGKTKRDAEHMDLPADLYNGMMTIALRNIDPKAPPTVSYLVATPKPQIVKLVVSNAGLDPFVAAGATVKATHYVIKVDIQGVKGLIAPLVGKQPPDSHLWILTGDAPSFVASETTFYMGGPLWRIAPADIVPPKK